ncbi:hypothetical protein CDL60_25850 [Roseateles noduli]|nr:hypothetical protein CDL60_25850 [Roseateles noduli]
MADWQEAWQRDCDTVRLAAPSTDLGEIKRAYAKTLRKTRPDDDAQAYQALREAYDRLVAHARWQLEHGSTAIAAVETDADAAKDADTDGATTIEPAPSSDDVVPAPPAQALPNWRTPEELRDWVLTLRQRGHPAMKGGLPELRAALDDQPLDLHARASIVFADLLLELQADLTPTLVEFLREHFGWDDDFRAQRVLGHLRMTALSELLRGIPRPVTDPVLLREYGPTARLAKLASSGNVENKTRALQAALLMGHALLLHLQRAGPWLLRRLGVEPSDSIALDKLTSRVLTYQLAFLAFIAFVMASATDRDLGDALGAAALAPLAAVIAMVLSHWAQVALGVVRNLLGSPLARFAPESWARRWPWIGVALMLTAGVIAQVALMITPWGLSLPIGSAVIALIAGAVLLAMPGDMTGIATLALLWLLADTIVPGTSTLLGGCLLWAWLLAGSLVYRERRYVPNPVSLELPRRPVGGARAAAVLATVGLPTLMTWLGDHCGIRFTLAVFVMTGGVFMLMPKNSPHLVWALPLALYGSIALLLAMKQLGWRLGRRLLGDDLAR